MLDVEVILVQMIDEGGGDAYGCRFTKLHESTAKGHGDRRVVVRRLEVAAGGRSGHRLSECACLVEDEREFLTFGEFQLIVSNISSIPSIYDVTVTQ